VHNCQEANLQLLTNNVMHLHIAKNASGEMQGADTHVNGPYKAGLKESYVQYQQDSIKQELDKYEANEGGAEAKQLADLEARITKGEDPSTFETWKSPVELSLKQPSRGQVIMWGRKARERFETQKGRLLLRDAFYSNGLVKGSACMCSKTPCVCNKYLMYSRCVCACAVCACVQASSHARLAHSPGARS
jgi:hypothetical protein